MTRDQARREVQRHVDAAGGISSFAKSAALDPGTLSDFLNGKRWPHARNRTKIEDTLGWPHGQIEDLANRADEIAVRPGKPSRLVRLLTLADELAAQDQDVLLALAERLRGQTEGDVIRIDDDITDEMLRSEAKAIRADVTRHSR